MALVPHLSHDIPPYCIANYMEVITGYGFDVASVNIKFTACFVKYDTSKGHKHTDTHTDIHIDTQTHTHTDTHTHIHTHTHARARYTERHKTKNT